MPKRTIVVQNRAHLSAKQNALIITNERSEVSIPFEDIWVLIIESHHVTITNAALSDLSDQGIGVLVCGFNHMPVGLMLPLAAHSRHAAIVETQLLMSKPLKKQLWQRIVKAKISNQAETMRLLGHRGYESLLEISKSVKSGDSDNRESVAAAYYFKHCIPEGTRRKGPYAPLLDYGYAVMRAGIARAAVAGGWLVSRGIHHSNDLNAFNLVDDLLEPFRPVVDLVVFSMVHPEGLTSDIKAELASVFEQQVRIEGRIFSVQTAIEEMLDSLKAAAIDDDSGLLVVPETAGLGKVQVDRK